MSTNPVTDSVGVPVDISGSGDHVLAEGIVGKVIRVFRIVLTFSRSEELADEFCDIVFKSGSTPLPGPIQLMSGGAITLELNQRRWLMCENGDDLVVNLSGDGRLSGAMTVLWSDE